MSLNLSYYCSYYILIIILGRILETHPYHSFHHGYFGRKETLQNNDDIHIQNKREIKKEIKFINLK